jgi:hypothetical protein
MCRRLALVLLSLFLPAIGFTSGARAQDGEIDCDSFVKNPDGSWTVVEKAYIPVQKVRVREGTVFRAGESFLGDDMTVRLSKACPNKAVAPVEGNEQAQEPQGQQGAQSAPSPYVSLSRYGDANGNIDIRRLSCSHLDQASPPESDLLLAWYSGWYTATAKARGINLPQVRYAMRSVADYCKANPDKSLAQVIELMLR